jgi:chromosome segregation ATPase
LWPTELANIGNGSHAIAPARRVIQTADPGAPMNLSHQNIASESIDSLRETLASLEQQLVSVYAERERESGVNFSSDETLAALYEDKQRLSARTIAELRESVENLTVQLADLYALRESGGADPESLQATIDGLTEQLHALYEERELDEYGPAGTVLSRVDATCMAESLTEQVAALLDERNDLAQECEHMKSEIRNTKKRAREMIDALVSQSLN